jgi:hypothetical protein
MLTVPPRRRFLQVGSLGLTGLSLASALRAEGVSATSRPRAKSCLLIYLDGGPSHIDLFDMKPEAPEEVRGSFQPIATTVAGTTVCEHMPLLSRQMHRLVQVRSVRHEELVHDPAVYQTLTGYKHVSTAGGLKVEDSDLPQMGCAFGRADRARVVLPRVVQIPQTMTMEKRVLPGQSGGILGPAWDPFSVEVTHAGETLAPSFERPVDVSLERVGRRSSLLRQYNQQLSHLTATASTSQLDVYQQQALEIVAAPSIQQAFDISRESPATHEAYGRHRHGQSVLLARRLIEAGSRFVTVYWGNEDQDWADGRGAKLANNPWDTHRNHFPLVKDSLLPRADQTLSALLADLANRGLLDETLVVWMGEFGRTPKVTRPWASRDHWPFAYTILMAGAGLPGGKVFGRTDSQAAYVEDDPVSPADVTATIFDALGVSPGTVVHTPDGRLHRLSEGRAVRELWS